MYGNKLAQAIDRFIQGTKLRCIDKILTKPAQAVCSNTGINIEVRASDADLFVNQSKVFL